jgi:hypothetical protein
MEEYEMEMLQKFLDALINFDTSAILTTVLVAWEILGRLIKTEKPAGAIRFVAGLVRKIGDIAVKLADILDKFLPQNLK